MSSPPPSKPRRLSSRRRWLGTVLALGALGAGANAAWRAQERKRAHPSHERALRPPGALAEAQFLAACIRCGLCVNACPYHTLKLATAADPVAPGTPFFTARQIPCEMCPDIPCTRACPTGALAPTLKRIGDARMGLAAVSTPSGCYSMIGAAICNSCVRACPVGAAAIVLKPEPTAYGGHFTPLVDAAHCTGCGRCEKACIASLPAITVRTEIS